MGDHLPVDVSGRNPQSYGNPSQLGGKYPADAETDCRGGEPASQCRRHHMSSTTMNTTLTPSRIIDPVIARVSE